MADNEEVLDLEGMPEAPAPEAPEPESQEPATETAEPEAKETPEFDGDINKLSPELQKVAKGFQAGYTKKMQALQAAYDGLATHKERLAILDKALSGDAAARKQVAQIIGANVPDPAPQDKFDPNQMPERFESSKQLHGWLNNWLQAQLQPILQQQVPMQQQMQRQAAEAEYNSVKAKYPDFDQHLQQMAEIREKNPGMPLEMCYKLATWRSPTPPEKITSKPGARPTSVKPKNDKALSFEEASELAIRELGLSRR